MVQPGPQPEWLKDEECRNARQNFCLAIHSWPTPVLTKLFCGWKSHYCTGKQLSEKLQQTPIWNRIYFMTQSKKFRKQSKDCEEFPANRKTKHGYLIRIQMKHTCKNLYCFHGFYYEIFPDWLCRCLYWMLKLEIHFDMSRNPLFFLQMLATELHLAHLLPSTEREIRKIYNKQSLTDSASATL